MRVSGAPVGVLPDPPLPRLSWVTQESPGSSYCLDAHFPSPETGYLVAAGGVLVKTTSGGDPVP